MRIYSSEELELLEQKFGLMEFQISLPSLESSQQDSEYKEDSLESSDYLENLTPSDSFSLSSQHISFDNLSESATKTTFHLDQHNTQKQ